MQLTLARRRKIKIAVTCLAVIMAVYVGTSVLGAAAAMGIPRLPLIASPASIGLTFQNVSFDSRVDKVPLDGWFIQSSGDAVLVLINGGFQNRVDPVVDTLGLAHDLQQQGYNILLFDLRGRGDSGGQQIRFQTKIKTSVALLIIWKAWDFLPIKSALSDFVPVPPTPVYSQVKIKSADWCLMPVSPAWRAWSITRRLTMVFRGR